MLPISHEEYGADRERWARASMCRIPSSGVVLMCGFRGWSRDEPRRRPPRSLNEAGRDRCTIDGVQMVTAYELSSTVTLWRSSNRRIVTILQLIWGTLRRGSRLRIRIPSSSPIAWRVEMETHRGGGDGFLVLDLLVHTACNERRGLDKPRCFEQPLTFICSGGHELNWRMRRRHHEGCAHLKMEHLDRWPRPPARSGAEVIRSSTSDG